MLDDPHAWYYAEGEQPETRDIVNAFIRRQYVTAPKWCWRYFDYLKEQGLYMGQWTRYLDMERRDFPFGEMFHYALWCQACRTLKRGKALPDFLPEPIGWEDFEEPDEPDPSLCPVN